MASIRAVITLALAIVLGAVSQAPAAQYVLADPDGTDAVLTSDPAMGEGLDTPPGPAATGLPESAAAGAGSGGRTVPGAIDRLRRLRRIDPATASGYRRTWRTAVATGSRLRGYRRAQLRAVLANTREIAADGLLTASRVAAVMLTVQRNRDWWSKGPSLRAGGRTRFRGSQLVWQHYPGQGLQIQWLGTFGRANALWSFTGKDDELAALLTEARSLAADRAGGIAYEYLFRFDGGRPPWVSGLAQGTALSAFVRGALRLRDPRRFDDARAALGIFRTAPPSGVRVRTAAGARYLQYSFSRSMRIGNGFVQSLNGLHDFAALANDREGWKLFAAGERQLRVELPRYDTGAWSRYSLGGRESDLGYHKLLRDFLKGLCRRLEDGERKRSAGSATTRRASAAQAAAPGDTATAPAQPGKPSPEKPSPAPSPGGAPVGGADPAPYCRSAARLTGELHERPVLTIEQAAVRRGRRATVRVRLSKISSATITVSRAGDTLASRSGLLARGSHTISVRPGKGRTLTVSANATDLAGNRARATARVRVPARRSHR